MKTEEIKQERYPNFFIVGVTKAGTTSLYEYLRNIPGIFMSPNKEPNYFNINTRMEGEYYHPIKEKSEYLKLFEQVKDEKIIGEGTSGYFYDHDSPKFLHQISPNARILISLRDPVERAFSHYLMKFYRGYTNRNFNEEITDELAHKVDKNNIIVRLEAGFYYQHVKRYLDFFDRNQVKIIIFEEWIKNPKFALNEILQFLGINHIINNFEDEVHNAFPIKEKPRGNVSQYLLNSKTISKITRKFFPSNGRRFIVKKILMSKIEKPKLDTTDRELLVKFYQNDVKKLKTLLGRDLPWPNFRNIRIGNS